MINPWEVLGIEHTTCEEAIKTAFRKRALETHPDTGGSKEAFQEVHKAYEMLMGKRSWQTEFGTMDPSRDTSVGISRTWPEVIITGHPLHVIGDDIICPNCGWRVTLEDWKFRHGIYLFHDRDCPGGVSENLFMRIMNDRQAERMHVNPFFHESSRTRSMRDLFDRVKANMDARIMEEERKNEERKAREKRSTRESTWRVESDDD